MDELKTDQRTDQDLYYELSMYTLNLGDTAFIHQYIVDAYCARHANQETKPIAIAFALMGLYLHHEKNYSGKQVQSAHMRMAQKKKEWPQFIFPIERGSITVAEVLKAKPGPDRNEMINQWSENVWQAWIENRTTISHWLKTELGIV